MARVFGNFNGMQFEGTYEECMNWILDAELEQEEAYPDADENDLEYYWVEEE